MTATLAPKAAIARPVPGEIKHVIVVMMENRSFDHFMGWVPGADGVQAGLTYDDSSGTQYDTYPLAPDYQGCSHPDPNHSYCGGRYEWNSGASDGWLFDCTGFDPSQGACVSGYNCSTNDKYAIGYYTAADLPFYAGAASNWTICDRYFAPIMASTWPNRIYQFAADTDRIDNEIDQDGDSLPDFLTLPTIFDLLAAANPKVEARYYFSDAPVLALWGAKYVPISRQVSQFFSDCFTGTLPAVSFVDPRLIYEPNGTSCDDHPFADVRCGQDFLNDIYEAVIASSNWPDTVLVINYDEWGGFFDHVDPDSVGRPAVPPAQAAKDNDQPGLRGFRVPCIVISPWAPHGSVASGIYDHTSVLKMIEWNWNLSPPLTVRDQNANNLADVLTLSSPDLSAPQFKVSGGPFSGPCPPPNSEPGKWWDLYKRAQSLGFPVPRVESIPAVSAWSVVAMTLLLLTAGTLVLRGRRTATAGV